MKKQVTSINKIKELTKEECIGITGGGEVTNYLRCMASTLTSGGGGVRTLVLGVGIFGLARLIGVAVGCANS
jgi:hypothetical protein